MSRAPASFRSIVRRDAHVDARVRKGIDLVSVARVAVSSEQALFPVDNAFDDQRGPGGSCWIAADGGEQTLTLAFDPPQTIRSIVVESEKHGGLHTQDIAVDVADDAKGEVFRELGSRSFGFKPYGPTFQTASWDVIGEPLTRVRLRITPEGRVDRASVTSVVIR
jgi:hypothetical protein